MEKERFEYIILRYLKGIAASEEEKELLMAIRSSDELYTAFREKTANWNPLEEKNMEADRKWNRIASIISPQAETAESAPVHTLPTTFSRTKWYSIAAAIVILCISGVTAFFLRTGDSSLATDHSKWLTATAGADDYTCILPDGTSVYLRKGSSLQYPEAFASSTRNVSIQGEAFFDVTHNAEKPFIVDASGLSIKVLGTSFSVDASNKDESISVTLLEGMVSLNDSNQKELVRLLPNQKADYIVSSGQYTVSDVDSERLTSWRKGIISYTNASLDEIVQLIEQSYGVSLQYSPQENDTERFSGAFMKSQNLNTVLDQTNKLTGSELTLSK